MQRLNSDKKTSSVVVPSDDTSDVSTSSLTLENIPDEDLQDECSSALSEGIEIAENIEAEEEEEEYGDEPDVDIDTPIDIDTSRKILDLEVLDGSRVSSGNGDEVEGLYVYKNVFNLIPRSVGGLSKLKTLKYFGNEMNLFPPEFGNLVGLERLQVKISLPSMTNLPLQKLKALKELELSKAPPRPSAFPLLADIMGLERLTRLSVCHFSIRYLPPEIGCLTCLEYLDISHNKLKNLPTEIATLSALITLKVANNKLVQVPSALSTLQRLETLDLSNNRLTSLGSLELDAMPNLQILNLQYNKLPSSSQLPVRIKCYIEGNDEDMANGEFSSSSVEMDVLESTVTDLLDHSINGSPASPSNHLTGSSSDSCILARKWRRLHRLQQRARQEHLNLLRKCLNCILKTKRKQADSLFVSIQNSTGNCECCNAPILPESLLEVSANNRDDDLGNKDLAAPADSSKQVDALESIEGKEVKDVCTENEAGALSDASRVQDEHLLVDSFCCNSNSHPKRHSERDPDNHGSDKKKIKATQTDIHSEMSKKYSTMSFCSIEDHLPDGFYDGGRDRPFLSISSYEKNLHLGSREVIVMDRGTDEGLDSITLCAQAYLSRLNQSDNSNKDGGDISLDKYQIASWLALFVSDHFGGSDKSAAVDSARKSSSGSNYNKPFVCSCRTGNNNNIVKSANHSISSSEDDLLGNCEKSLQLVKARRNSIIVPIGSLQYGVCRHRALLMKYLCDRVKPRVPCELVRGYLDFAPHAWNVVVVKRGDSEVRMVVDACRPCDIKPEMDPEYLCRYIPLSRISCDASLDMDSSFPSLSACEKIGEGASTTLVKCNLGSVGTAAKVRLLKVGGSSPDEIRNFEFNCLGEVRLLNVLKHPCIVRILGHRISTKWLPSQNGTQEDRILQSVIFMEHVKGGSLKHYLEKLARSGEKHVPLELALQIVRDISWALSEVHSKDVIHRDLKSANILIDLAENSHGKPIVKLCDFDRAIPVRSPYHTCCIGHVGIPPPNVCVGTPRWMAPEVYRTIHNQHLYGLEVDIWSFGCLLLEILTLQVPYAGLPESEINDLLLIGKRPALTDELEALEPLEDTETTQFETAEYRKARILRFLIDIYRQCTKGDPNDRPTAEKLYQVLDDFSNSTNVQV
uniref:uncharacterized protein LOC122596493 n=1 Tax=Erigeron canadensis TaxID=72917 RepID=UPI001CB8ABEC|nr:uncharacterized protein LOC122596493 [Erigeron canadensis]